MYYRVKRRYKVLSVIIFLFIVFFVATYYSAQSCQKVESFGCNVGWCYKPCPPCSISYFGQSCPVCPFENTCRSKLLTVFDGITFALFGKYL